MTDRVVPPYDIGYCTSPDCKRTTKHQRTKSGKLICTRCGCEMVVKDQVKRDESSSDPRQT